MNKNYTKCVVHSNLHEFVDIDKPKLCFLDDNFFSCPDWKSIIEEVKSTGKRFQFKQGLDERLLNKDKIDELVSWKYDGEIIFAFDNIEDEKIIIEKLELLYRLYPDLKKQLKFYVFCGFDRSGVYDDDFWVKDIKSVLDRCRILSKYSALPFVMRHERAYTSPYEGIYRYLANWANQPWVYKFYSFENFCIRRGMTESGYKRCGMDIEKYLQDIGTKYASWRTYDSFINKHPEMRNYTRWSPKEVVVKGCWCGGKNG